MSAKGLAISATMLWAISSCATAPAPDAKEPDEHVAEQPTEPVPGGSDAYGVSGYEVDECSDKTCSANTECCDGYSCAYDPERSHVQRYCLRG